MRVAAFCIWLANATVSYVSRDLLHEGLVIEWRWEQQLSWVSPEKRNAQFNHEMKKKLNVCAYRDLEKRKYMFNYISTDYYKSAAKVCFNMSDISESGFTLVHKQSNLHGIELKIEPRVLQRKLGLGDAKRQSLHFALTEGICPAGSSWDCSGQPVVQTQTLVAGFEHRDARGGLFTCKRWGPDHSEVWMHKDNVACLLNNTPYLNPVFVGEAPVVDAMDANYGCTVTEGGFVDAALQVDIAGARIQRLRYENADYLTFKNRLLPRDAPEKLELRLVKQERAFLNQRSSYFLDILSNDEHIKATCYYRKPIADGEYPAQQAAIEVHRSEQPSKVYSWYLDYRHSNLKFQKIYSDDVVDNIRYDYSG